MEWGEGMFAAQEAKFIPNPDGTEEDDGVLLVVGYKMDKKETALYAVDAKTMKTITYYPTPFPLPAQWHASYWPDYVHPDDVKKNEVDVNFVI